MNSNTPLMSDYMLVLFVQVSKIFFVNFSFLDNTAFDLPCIVLYKYRDLMYYVDCWWRVYRKKRNIIVDIFLQI